MNIQFRKVSKLQEMSFLDNREVVAVGTGVAGGLSGIVLAVHCRGWVVTRKILKNERTLSVLTCTGTVRYVEFFRRMTGTKAWYCTSSTYVGV